MKSITFEDLFFQEERNGLNRFLSQFPRNQNTSLWTWSRDFFFFFFGNRHTFRQYLLFTEACCLSPSVRQMSSSQDRSLRVGWVSEWSPFFDKQPPARGTLLGKDAQTPLFSLTNFIVSQFQAVVENRVEPIKMGNSFFCWTTEF